VKRLPILLALLLEGCARYADFTLPPPDAQGPRPPFRWEPRANPVLTPGSAGEWDSVDALNPAVIRFGGGYLNLYSGYDGRQWSTGVARSADGIEWRRQGRVLGREGW